MSNPIVPLKLDRFGGLTDLEPLKKFDASDQVKTKIINHLRTKLVPEGKKSKCSFIMYILGYFFLLCVLITLVVLLQNKSLGILVLMVIFPVSFIISWSVAANLENKWMLAIRKSQKNILHLSDFKASMELGYGPRIGSDLKKEKNLFNFGLHYLIFFNIQNSKFPIQKNEFLKLEKYDLKCILSPYKKTSVERLNSKKEREIFSNNKIQTFPESQHIQNPYIQPKTRNDEKDENPSLVNDNDQFNSSEKSIKRTKSIELINQSRNDKTGDSFIEDYDQPVQPKNKDLENLNVIQRKQSRNKFLESNDYRMEYSNEPEINPRPNDDIFSKQLGKPNKDFFGQNNNKNNNFWDQDLDKRN
jgi:hypothetical protein